MVADVAAAAARDVAAVVKAAVVAAAAALDAAEKAVAVPDAVDIKFYHLLNYNLILINI